MKRWVLLLSFIIFVCIPIVYEQDQADLIRKMTAKEDGFYHMYVFLDHADTVELPLESVLWPFNSEDFRRSLHISKLQVVHLNEQNLRYRYAKIFDIKRTPAYVILDHQRVVLETTQIEDIPPLLGEKAVWLSSRKSCGRYNK